MIMFAAGFCSINFFSFHFFFIQFFFLQNFIWVWAKNSAVFFPDSHSLNVCSWVCVCVCVACVLSCPCLCHNILEWETEKERKKTEKICKKYKQNKKKSPKNAFQKNQWEKYLLLQPEVASKRKINFDTIYLWRLISNGKPHSLYL